MSILSDIRDLGHAVAKVVDAALPDVGDWIQRSADILGVPERIGEAVAAAYNVATGNCRCRHQHL
jgi:hypothetical protein